MANTIAGRPFNDYADNWLSLFELFVSVSGLKLRLNIPDTVIIKDGRMVGWFYTSKEGAISRCALHEISPAALFQKLVGSASLDDALNPCQYVALCHFESGVSRPLKRNELQNLTLDLVGPYETARPRLDAAADVPFCIQAYIIPDKDLRLLATYGGYEQATCTVFARHFSARYTHVTDGPGVAAAASVQEGDGGDASLSSEELVVESQLVAMGLLEPRRPLHALAGGEDDVSVASEDLAHTPRAGDAALPASRKAKAEVARLIQALISFVERAHGLRIQGLVTEFVQADAHGEVLVLLAVHAVQWDGRSSKGRLGTFTERWQDYTNGLGPAPAAQPPGRRTHQPGLFLPHTDSSASATMVAEHSGGPSPGSQGGFPRSPTTMASSLRGPDSPGRASMVGRAPLLRHAGSEMCSPRVSAVRPGSALAHVVHKFGPGFPGPRNGRTTLRSAIASARRGAGGNPGAVAPALDSYSLFTNRETLSTDTVAGSLVLEVETLKERLQRQTDVAARAEAALTQLAAASQATQESLLQQLGDAKTALEAATQGRSHLEREHERLYTERAALNARINELEAAVSQAQSALQQDRATLAEAVRSSAYKEGGLQDMCVRLKEENDTLSSQVVALQRRLEEEGEVVEAARNQLYDYRQMVNMLQTQLRRGKNKPAGALGAGTTNPGIASSVNSLNGAAMPPNMLPLASGGSHLRASIMAEATDAGSESGRLLGEEPPPLKPPAKAKRPGNSPLNPAARVRTLNKSETTPVHRSCDGTPDRPLCSAPQIGAIVPELPSSPTYSGRDRSGSFSGSSLEIIPGLGPGGGVSLLQISVSPRAAERQVGLQLGAGGPGGSQSQVTVGSSSVQQLIASTNALLARPPPDAVFEAIAELRRARKYGSAEVGNPFALLSGSPQAEKEVKASAAVVELAKVKTQKVVTMEDKAKKVVNSFKPVYENLHLNDVFIITGELSERMAETHAHIIKLLQKYESELLEIYNYYAALGQVQYMDGKMMMFEPQFLKLARASGVSATGLHGDPAEDVFHQLGERVTSYYSEFNPKTEFITFPEFPEAVCRLAAAKYDWRPPEQPEEADDDIEQPEALRTCPLANISELGDHCNLYGVGPTAKLSAAARTPEAEVEMAAAAAAAFRGEGATHAPQGGDGEDEEDDEKDSAHEDASVIAAVAELGPQPPDVVLYAIIKTYLLYDLFPHVKRNKTMGSRISKFKSMKRTAPASVWM